MYKKRRRHLAVTFALFKVAILATLLIFISCGMVLTVYGILAKGYDLKQLGKMPLPSTVYDCHGNEIGKIHGSKLKFIALKEVSSDFQKALIIREDVRFYEHKGIDPTGILRAFYRNVFKKKREGASTITMQLARNSFSELMSQKTLHRKLIEAQLARRIEKEYSKDQILEFYINRIFFGSGIYGIENASLSYFGKKAIDMNLSEAAMLAGIIRGPNRFSPFRNFKAANEQRKTVLGRMHQERVITRNEFQNAMLMGVKILPQNFNKKERVKSYAMDAIQRELNNALGESNTEDGGLKIHTSIDLLLQNKVEEILERSLQAIEKRPGYNHPTKAQYDSIKLKKTPDYIQGSVVIMDNKTGAVLAIVGGRDIKDSEFNRALNAKRPLGSIFKPFVYTAAFNQGLMPGSLISDGPIKKNEIEGAQTNWMPRNHDMKSYGLQTVNFGLYKSRNTMSARIGNIAGIDNIKALSEKVGIKISSSNPQIFLGNVTSDLQSITSAYTVFPNYGRRAPSFTIHSIDDINGKTFYKAAAQTYPAVSSGPITMTCMALEKVMSKHGTGSGSKALGYKKQVGGKTGTTDDSKDAWFLGFSSRVTCGVWVGLDKPKTILKDAYASNITLPIWTKIMQECEKFGYTAENMIPPIPMSEINLCRISGKRASKECIRSGSSYLEKIPYDSIPQDYCQIHSHIGLSKNRDKKPERLKVLKKLFQSN